MRGQVVFLLSSVFRYLVDQLFGLLPAEAGVGYRFAEHAVAYRLPPVLQIAFDHKPFHQLFQLAVGLAAGEHFARDIGLPGMIAPGIIVVDVDYHGGVFQPARFVKRRELFDRFPAVVGDAFARMVYKPAQYGVRVGVSGAFDH